MAGGPAARAHPASGSVALSAGFDPTDVYSLAGQTAVVTGGGRGIGAAIARAFARCGAAVHVLDRDEAAARATAASITAAGGRAVARACDVTDEAAIDAQMAAVIAVAGRLDILVANAGVAIRRPSTELTLADWDAVVRVNLTGVFLSARSAARHMIARGSGSIVTMASIMGLSGGGLYPNISYQATKGAVVNLTRALAVEWAASGVRVNAIAPTWVRTDFIRPLTDDPELLARMKAMTPLGRIAEVDDIAGAAVFLCSRAARMITGQVLAVDGGFLAQ
jgi:NAD(P)-dependent dehydrogenase (short-subunit alcohol dehydrogenase family)